MRHGCEHNGSERPFRPEAGADVAISESFWNGIVTFWNDIVTFF